jgi:hypothetical protein
MVLSESWILSFLVRFFLYEYTNNTQRFIFKINKKNLKINLIFFIKKNWKSLLYNDTKRALMFSQGSRILIYTLLMLYQSGRG